MSTRTPPVMDAASVSLSFADVLQALAALEVSFSRRGVDGLHLMPAHVLSAELRASVCEHKPALLALADIRARLALLHERIIALRLADPPKGTRDAALRWLSHQADKLAGMAQDAGLLIENADGQPVGYADVSDPCADVALAALHAEIIELDNGGAAGLYPAPWPPSVDLADSSTVFAAGRLLNGKISKGQ